MNSPWIMTYSGRKFYPLEPRPEDLSIEDIAYALSNLCRYNGHVRKGFYSVAQHSVIVSENCPPKFALYGLLHDASEGAALGDLLSPMKRLDKFAYYREVENKIQSMIYRKFGLEPYEPKEVKEADLRTLATEIRDLMGGELSDWDLKYEPYNFIITPLQPAEANKLFLDRFNSLTK